MTNMDYFTELNMIFFNCRKLSLIKVIVLINTVYVLNVRYSMFWTLIKKNSYDCIVPNQGTLRISIFRFEYFAGDVDNLLVGVDKDAGVGQKYGWLVVDRTDSDRQEEVHFMLSIIHLQDHTVK